MSKKQLPKIKRIVRGLGKSAAGAYGFDNGSVCFDDLFERIGKKAKIRQKARETWKQNGSVKKSSKSDYHRKHG